MRFEVVNDKNKTVMQTSDASCIPSESDIKVLAKAGYKFKIDGKTVTKAVLLKYINEEVK